MKYKIVSNNIKLIERIRFLLNGLDISEAIHIQAIDLFLVDVKTVDKKALNSYKNIEKISKILFIVNDSEDIKLCLENSFTNYINSSFSKEELSSWCKYFKKNKKEKFFTLTKNTKLDLENSQIIQNNKKIELTKQEKSLIKQLLNFSFVSSQELASFLNLNSTTSVRTIITRIRKKLEFDIFEQKKSYGYKLLKDEKKVQNKFTPSLEKELLEQNSFLQNIIDSSPIFIVTFIHKQLYCINKSFRDYLGNEIIKELWSEEKGDFFQLIEYKDSNKEKLKDKLFTKGKHKVKLYETNNNKTSFEIETFYFQNLDKHLFIFTFE